MWAIPGHFFFIFVFSIQLIVGKQLNVRYKSLPMTSFEPLPSVTAQSSFFVFVAFYLKRAWKRNTFRKNWRLARRLKGASVIRFGKMLPLWQIFQVFGNFSLVLFRILQNFEPTLLIFCYYWANFHYWKWPNKNPAFWSHWLMQTSFNLHFRLHKG